MSVWDQLVFGKPVDLNLTIW